MSGRRVTHAVTHAYQRLKMSEVLTPPKAKLLDMIKVGWQARISVR
jgi:hypothetical protein